MARTILTSTIGTSTEPLFGNSAEPNAATAAQAALLVTAKASVVAADTAAGTVVGAHQTATEGAVATLEADGALPTQGHVTALRAAWNNSKADETAAKAATATAVTNTNAVSLTVAAAAVAADVTLLVNAATVVTRNKILKVLAGFQQLLDGTNLLT